MNISQKQWRDALEEFQNKAFNRVFTILEGNIYYPKCNGTVNAEIEQGFWIFQFRPLPELHAHDIEFYGLENSITMWQWRYSDHSNDWQDCDKGLSFNPDKKYRRKTSAALPFDLERARIGDSVEYLSITGQWVESLVDFSKPENSIVSKDVYRMKYLPKLEKNND